MVSLPIASTPAGLSAKRWLQSIGAIGSLLALIILGASMLLRLTSIFGADGHVISTLPAATEATIRMFHRVAASAVGLLAVGVVILCWARRPLPACVVKPIASVLAATLILALIGPLTPGYRVAAVTILNVLGGVVLLMAFWWLRESMATDPAARLPVTTLLRAAILVFLAQVATGAAASATQMHGVRVFAVLHLGSALLSTMFVGACLWERKATLPVAAWSIAAAGIMMAQLTLGFVLMGVEARPLWLAFLHAMLAPMLAISLVSLAIRSPTPVGITRPPDV